MTTALLVIDLQQYFLEVGSGEKLTRVGTLVARTNDLIDFFHAKGLPVVKVQTVHRADGSTWNQAMRPHWTGQPIHGTLTEGTREAEQHPDSRRCCQPECQHHSLGCRPYAHIDGQRPQCATHHHRRHRHGRMALPPPWWPDSTCHPMKKGAMP